MQITLRAARVNKDLTVEEAANRIQAEYEKLGGGSRKVTKYVLTDWETGRTMPNVLHLKAIEVVYGISYNNLLFVRPDSC